jgi:hypothetical protein
MNRGITGDSVSDKDSVDDAEQLFADPDHHVIVARRNRLLGLAIAGVTTVGACAPNVTVDASDASSAGGMGGSGNATTTTDASASIADAGDADIIDATFHPVQCNEDCCFAPCGGGCAGGCT